MTMKRLIPLALAITAGVFAIGACSPMPAPGTTTTTSTTVPSPWPGATCLDGAGTDGAAAPDLLFNGTPNARGNATFFLTYVNGSFSFSGNGTCGGLPAGAITVVRAASKSAADALCVSLNSGTNATSFTGSPWTLPADAWSCDQTISL